VGRNEWFMTNLEVVDEDVVQKCLQGDKEAFSILVEKYKKPVLHFIYRMVKSKDEANDLAQDTFIKVYENLWKFNRDKKFSSWMFQIAKNLSLDYLKKKKPLYIEDEVMENYTDLTEGPEEMMTRIETKQELSDAVEKLPTHLKTAVILYHINNLSYKEISDALDIPLYTVKNQLFKARKKLKQILNYD
jgi:RNA polymerase sigma-70 factor (ECF subfamily)